MTKKLLVLAVAALAVSAPLRVADVEIAEDRMLVVDGERVFVLGLYENPDDDAELARVAESGFNLVRSGASQDALDRLDAHGLWAWLNTGGAVDLSAQSGDSLRSLVETCAGHPALAVWEVPDEALWNCWYRATQWRRGAEPRQQRERIAALEDQGLARELGEALERVRTLYGTARLAEADALAKARLDELSGTFVQAEGTALRRPDIRAGKTIELSALGDRFSGTYLVTHARHVYTAQGRKTTFAVHGTRTGQLIETLGLDAQPPRYAGAAIGIVTNTDDPSHWGRVKVKFPWMTEDAESEWARVMGPGAGPEAGLFFIPDVDDEVLVLFEQGDFRRPYVIGGLWNGQDAPPPEAPSSGQERPLVRTWRSRTGHHITVYDNADNRIEIVTKTGHRLVLDDSNNTVTLKTDGGLVLTLSDNDGKITLEGNEISIKASGNLKVESGANMDLQAGGQVNIQGALINLN